MGDGFRIRLERLIEEAALAACAGDAEWWMEDETLLLGMDVGKLYAREGSLHEGWRIVHWPTGTHALLRSPTTGATPPPPPVGPLVREGALDFPSRRLESWRSTISNAFSDILALPDPEPVALAAQSVLDSGVRALSWQAGQGHLVNQDLGPWLDEIEQAHGSFRGQAGAAFFARFGQVRDVVGNNLRQCLVDVTACAAADAAALHAVQEGALSLARALRDAMRGARPEAGPTVAEAAWGTLSTVSSVLPAKGAVGAVANGLKLSTSTIQPAVTSRVSGGRPDDAFSSFQEPLTLLHADANEGFAEIEAEAVRVATAAADPALTALPRGETSAAPGELQITRRQVDDLRDSLGGIARLCVVAADAYYEHDGRFRGWVMCNPWPGIDRAATIVRERLTDLAAELLVGSDALEAAWQAMQTRDAATRAAFHALGSASAARNADDLGFRRWSA